MKTKHILNYFSSLFFLFVFAFSQAQEKATDKPTIETINLDKSEDSIPVKKDRYGLRVGVDLFKFTRGFYDKNYKGIELTGDFRWNKKYYLAAEIGNENKTTEDDRLTSTSKGSYLKVGFDYNLYENWLDMNNEIFLGMRYGLSFFEQTLNSYTPNVNTTYFPANPILTNETSNVNAHWTEFMVGFKVETLKNFFISASVSYKVLISVKEPNNFKTLYSPGFNRIFDSGTGFGFNYTLEGTADDPEVAVNPLSILTPGMFRDLFRARSLRTAFFSVFGPPGWRPDGTGPTAANVRAAWMSAAQGESSAAS